MKVNFYATLRPIAGQKTIEFDFDEGITAQQVLDAVVKRFPKMRDELVDEN
ncbi:MAG: MoaD/ThiS family protein, partial [Chloroflexi bacterium]|nr:MoaD/ThiS family protein [Chloroflexota bacterium]